MDTRDLFPIDSEIRVREVAITPDIVAVVAEPAASITQCPGCGSPSEHVHGRYLGP